MSDPIPGWNMDRPIGVITQPHDGLTVMDGIRLGFGLAIAWLVLVPVAVFVTLVLISALT